ncbi:ATP-binding protein [Deinococcus sonorensis]|uniref:histidine kinase n=2 Tax=Deinococcus sonorensis TaxID=309891 RepID=A0AAU7U752_9DEIO
MREERRERKRAARRHRRRPTGLRARLTRTFVLVAVLAVALTSFLTVGSVFRVLRQEQLSPTSLDATPARTAGQQITSSAVRAGLLIAGLASVVAAGVTRQITRPLSSLTEAARRLEAGERGVQVPVPPRADEVQTLILTFNALTTRLARQEAWRRGLVADIAHDLRTPLAVLRSEIEAMQDGLVSPDEAGLARLHGEVLLLARLVSDLRTLSLAESGAMSLNMQPLDAALLLRSAVDAHRGRAGAAGVQLTLDAPGPVPFHADPDRMTQVLNNLIDNALRYAAPGPLDLQAGQEGQRVVLRVRDHGPGFQSGDLSRAFERFFRAEASRTRHTDDQGRASSGLGLAIARALVEAQGGHIEARNHPQGGAEFVMQFPADTPGRP